MTQLACLLLTHPSAAFERFCMVIRTEQHVPAARPCPQTAPTAVRVLAAPMPAQVMLLFSRSERHDEARRKEYEEYIRAMEEIAAKKQKQKDVASEDDQELPATPVHRIKAAAASDASATANRMATATSATPFLLDANVKTSSVANLQSTVDVRGNAGSPGDEVAKGKGKGGGVKVHAAAENKLRKRVGQSGEAEVEGKQQREERDHAIVELGDVAVDMSLEAGSVAGSSGKGSGKGSKDGDDEEEEEPKKPLLKRMHNLVREDAAFKWVVGRAVGGGRAEVQGRGCGVGAMASAW